MERRAIDRSHHHTPYWEGSALYHTQWHFTWAGAARASRRSRALFAAIIALIAPPCVAHAQATGGVSGTVTSEGGAPVPGAQVSIANLRLGPVTGDDGRYTITRVPSGTYVLRVNRLGFRANQQSVSVTV